MQKILSRILVLIITLQLSFSFAQSVNQKLTIIQNDLTLNGSFKIELQVKGSSLPSANTLANATIDIQFDDSKLSFVDANSTSWAFGTTQGYTRNADLNTDVSGTFVRVSVNGSSVNGNGGGDPPGFDIENSATYDVSWVTLNFTISNASGTTDLFIRSLSNAISLYPNHSNNPATGTPIAQTLTRSNINNAPLPVELTSFTASTNNNFVNLNWNTATEVNNYGFDVEKQVSSNQSAVSNWKKIGFVQGYGNSNSPKNYSFTDKNLTDGTKFKYRLKQIDINGQYEYSKEVEVEIAAAQFVLEQNYPNPFNPTTKIKFELPQAARVTLIIYNILGQQVANLLNENLEAGFHSVTFNAANLPSGTYVYRLQAGNFVQTKKMILLR